MDKVIEFARDIHKQIEDFEKKNNTIIKVMRWGISAELDDDNNLTVGWGDPNSRFVDVEIKE